MGKPSCPNGVTSYATFFRLVWFHPDEKVVTKPGEPLPVLPVGGITWN